MKSENQSLKEKFDRNNCENEILKKENSSLSKKIRSLEEAIVSPSGDAKNSAIQRLIRESPAPESLKRYRNQDEIDSLTPEITRKIPKISKKPQDYILSQKVEILSQKENSSESSPKLKSCSITYTDNPFGYSNNSIRPRNSLLSKSKSLGTIKPGMVDIIYNT